MRHAHVGRRHPRVLATGVAVVGATAALVGAALTWPAEPDGETAGSTPAARSAPPSTPSPRSTPASGRESGAEQPGNGRGRGAGRPEGQEASQAAAEPVRVVVPQLGIDAAVVPVASSAGALDPPPDPQVIGWWSGGAVPGAASGSALLAGHTVHDGGGALDHLEDVRRAALVRVRTARGTLDYRVRSVRVLDKAALAAQATRLFSQEVDGRLVLVTCEGWDGSGYRSNVVVTAIPTT